MKTKKSTCVKTGTLASKLFTTSIAYSTFSGVVVILSTLIGTVITKRGMSNAYILAVIVISLIAVLVLSSVLTKKLRRHIIAPINELEMATVRMSDGNLDEEIFSSDSDEIGKLFRSFDEMRVKLKQITDENERSSEIRRVMLSGVSHDLGTPLTKIKGYSEGFLDGIADTPEKQYRYVKIINENACDMDYLIRQMSGMLNFDIAKIPVNMKYISADELIKSFAEQISFNLGQKSIKFVINNRCSKHPVCNLDINSCKRVVDNIVSNSIKYRRQDITEPRLVMTMEIKDDSFVVSFADNGIGVNPGDEKKIFDYFYREDKARRNIKDGSGLGLAVSKQIIERHGGKMWAENNGEGLTVGFSLPVVSIEE